MTAIKDQKDSVAAGLLYPKTTVTVKDVENPGLRKIAQQVDEEAKGWEAGNGEVSLQEVNEFVDARSLRVPFTDLRVPWTNPGARQIELARHLMDGGEALLEQLHKFVLTSKPGSIWEEG